MNNSLQQLTLELRSYSDNEKAALLSRFFKTGKGEYGEGDIFIGVTVLHIRIVAKKFKNTPLSSIQKLLQSPIHEERLCALIIATMQFERATETEREQIYTMYNNNLSYVNNWDLVDQSASRIAGAYLADKPRDRLYELAKSKTIWKKRVAIIATLYFIVKRHEYNDTFAIAEILLHDTHDLIHKAVGWMLREVGNYIGENTEQLFLNRHYKTMPRTMLRYAIERFDEQTRLAYLQGNI